ncbi:formate dehydrogenase [Klebsormidium nitens]|uniref:Formate dehydrogenase, mitochondrial n=1 Tax=Klebsormidium nitens TaxID=105231 RepID=A0A1Y1HXH7_KLENI|nr:formate dehydrogenase [Klebsormidium nitens]|eukprot:GAQ83364.1 formate dehydrogenase [Klebsormidium nitens]
MGGKERHEGKHKILAVLYKAGEYADNKKFLACAENGLGVKEWLKEQGHEFIVTDDKEGPDSELEKQLPTIDILITTPFHPAYMSKERIQKAKNLKLIITAGVGSDHIDLHAAAEAGMTVTEIAKSNVTSVAEDEIMRILILIRNFIPGYQQVIHDDWNVAAVAHKAYDLEHKTVGTLGAGSIGQEMMKRLQNWDLNLLYYARHQNEKIEKFGAVWEKDLDTFLSKCDVVSINVPLTDKTRGMIGKEQLSKMKKGAYLVNNARGDIVVREAIGEALESGQLNGYGGDVWYPQPPGKDHPWRHMPNHAMTPHLSGTTLDAQARYADGTKKILECWFDGKPLPEEDYIVREGELASQYQ